MITTTKTMTTMDNLCQMSQRNRLALYIAKQVFYLLTDRKVQPKTTYYIHNKHSEQITNVLTFKTYWHIDHMYPELENLTYCYPIY